MASYDDGDNWQMVVADLPATARTYSFRTAPGEAMPLLIRVVARDLRFQNSSAERAVSLTPGSGFCPADLGRQGGAAGQDGILDNNDFIVFINMFFGADPAADVGSQGGLPGRDGLWNNNDFIVYINLFFGGC